MSLDQEIEIADSSSKPKFTYDFNPHCVNIDEPLIYKWTITNHQELCIGVYIGKAKGGHKRPTTQYSRNVNRLIGGEPYRKNKQDAWRKVHHALAEATHEGFKIQLEFICNVLPEENINVVERSWIEKEDCKGPAPWQLNG